MDNLNKDDTLKMSALFKSIAPYVAAKTQQSNFDATKAQQQQFHNDSMGLQREKFDYEKSKLNAVANQPYAITWDKDKGALEEYNKMLATIESEPDVAKKQQMYYSPTMRAVLNQLAKDPKFASIVMEDIQRLFPKGV